MTTRDTLLRVTLPLVWESRQLMAGPSAIAVIEEWARGWEGYTLGKNGEFVGRFPTRAAAEAAVEAAVMQALGERREG